MAESNENSINTCETAPLLQDTNEETVSAPPENGAGMYSDQTDR